MCIRMGITIFKIFFWGVYRRIYVRKSRFTAPLARRHKTKFRTDDIPPQIKNLNAVIP